MPVNSQAEALTTYHISWDQIGDVSNLHGVKAPVKLDLHQPRETPPEEGHIGDPQRHCRQREPCQPRGPCTCARCHLPSAACSQLVLRGARRPKDSHVGFRAILEGHSLGVLSITERSAVLSREDTVWALPCAAASRFREEEALSLAWLSAKSRQSREWGKVGNGFSQRGGGTAIEVEIEWSVLGCHKSWGRQQRARSTRSPLKKLIVCA